tara:strand:+ start:19427 stop:20212 length:786 start_codon:yes stop_codon:yes gene_type:complete
MPKTLLVDADILVYKITSALEEPVDWGNDEWTLHCDFKQAKEQYLELHKYYLKKSLCDFAIHCFSDKENFRKDLDSSYKAHRKSIRKPICYKPLKDFVCRELTSQIYPRLEGDDTIGILATGTYKDKCVIFSTDKDLKTIAGIHYNEEEDKLIKISEKQADYNFLTQTLTGDTADGYAGCKGVGKVSAKRLLKPSNTINENWEIVVKQFEKAGLTPNDAYHQSRLARIVRDGEYNTETNTINLWSFNYEKYTNIKDLKQLG